MKINNKIKKTISSILILLFTSLLTVAQTQINTEKSADSYSFLSIILILFAVILLFVIWGMGQALVTIARLLHLKSKSLIHTTEPFDNLELPKRQSTKINSKTNPIVSILILLGLFGLSKISYAQTATPIAESNSGSHFGGLSSAAFYAYTSVIITELFIIAMLTIFIKRLFNELMPSAVKSKKTNSSIKSKWTNLDKKIFTKAIPIEKEADILLDHDYDGIKELDNALPPWWKYGFVLTIIVALIYLTNFHVLGIGQNPTEEFQTEMENARIAKEEYDALNKDKIDEANVPMADAVGIGVGNEIFHQPGMCSSCHGQLAEGGAGPNLTDDYWIHKGSLNDIYKSIKNGYADKGMQSWENKFTPKQISQLTSYIKSLHGSNPPNAQPPKGDLYLDTTKNKINTDTVKIK